MTPSHMQISNERLEALLRRVGRMLGASSASELIAILSSPKHLIECTPARKGPSEVLYVGSREILLVSEQPLLDTARLLLNIGCDPSSIITKRRPGSDHEDIRAMLKVAAAVTVDAGRNTFRTWRGLSTANAGLLAGDIGTAMLEQPSSRTANECAGVTLSIDGNR